MTEPKSRSCNLPNGRKYKLFPERRPLLAATHLCRRSGGRLVQIDDVSSADDVIKCTGTSDYDYWVDLIGCHDDKLSWVPSCGFPFQVSAKGNHPCVGASLNPLSFAKTGTYDVTMRNCDDELGFVCELGNFPRSRNMFNNISDDAMAPYLIAGIFLLLKWLFVLVAYQVTKYRFLRRAKKREEEMKRHKRRVEAEVKRRKDSERNIEKKKEMLV